MNNDKSIIVYHSEAGRALDQWISSGQAVLPLVCILVALVSGWMLCAWLQDRADAKKRDGK